MSVDSNATSSAAQLFCVRLYLLPAGAACVLLLD
jgi:hypothetical protein